MPGLEQSKLFHSLNEAEMRLLRKVAVEKTVAAEEVIFKEGDPGDGLYVVKEGLVVIYAVIGQGQKQPFAKIGPGDFFGEMAVLDKEPRSATVMAEQPSTLFFISRDDLHQMLEASPRLAVALVREFSLRMRDFNRKYINETG
jgi:CRP/FNR family transcriptional regulator, cyclic AMP receptor protein